jgi:hypothetical protein
VTGLDAFRPIEAVRPDLAASDYKDFLPKSIPAQIRHLIFDISNEEG